PFPTTTTPIGATSVQVARLSGHGETPNPPCGGSGALSRSVPSERGRSRTWRAWLHRAAYSPVPRMPVPPSRPPAPSPSLELFDPAFSPALCSLALLPAPTLPWLLLPASEEPWS